MERTTVIRTLASGALALMGFAATEAFAFDYRLCNDSGKDTIRVAATSLEEGEWLTEGYWFIDNGQCTTLSFSSSPIYVRAEDTDLYTYHWSGSSLFCSNDVEDDWEIWDSGASCGNAYGEYRAQFFPLRAGSGQVATHRFTMNNAKYVGKDLRLCNRTNLKADFWVGYKIGPFAPLSTEGRFTIQAGECLTYDFPNFDSAFYVAAKATDSNLHWGNSVELCYIDGYEFDVEDPGYCFEGTTRFARVPLNANGLATYELRQDNAIVLPRAAADEPRTAKKPRPETSRR